MTKLKFSDILPFYKFDYIIPLGYNCEVAYRFLQRFKFLDSSLFAWTYIEDGIKGLLFALKNIDLILSDQISDPSPLYRCNVTHINFHGKGQNIEDINIEEEKQDIKLRIHYLKEKFKRILQSNGSKLFIYKIHRQDYNNPKINEYINELYLFLQKSTNKFKLLLITEKTFNGINVEYDNLILKYVKEYSPDSDVVGENQGDKKGWEKIFSKYRPKRIIKKNKAFKFEDVNDTNLKQSDKYDMFFSIGEACSCTTSLRNSKLQFYSYPFDWVWGADIKSRAEILANNFEKWFEKQDLEYFADNDISNPPKYVYNNKKTNIKYNHDFDKNVAFNDAYEKIKEKYERRSKRLITQIENSKSVLAVWLQCPNNEKIENNKILYETYEILKKRFPDVDINLLYLYNKQDISLKNRKIEYLSNNIQKIGFEYDAHDENTPYTVNEEILLKFYSKYNISNKYLTYRSTQARLRHWFKLLRKGYLGKY